VASSAVAAEAGWVPAAPDTNGLGQWLPPDWQHPRRFELPTGHHLRPIRSSDVDLHLRAVLESQERLWAVYGQAWQWPPRTLTVEQDREQLSRREADGEQQRSFTYALFDLGETELLGCVDIDPATGGGATAAVSWWVVDWLVDSPIERALDGLVPNWIAADWPVTPQRGPIRRQNGS
jgi:hypothetical protein